MIIHFKRKENTMKRIGVVVFASICLLQLLLITFTYEQDWFKLILPCSAFRVKVESVSVNGNYVDTTWALKYSRNWGWSYDYITQTYDPNSEWVLEIFIDNYKHIWLKPWKISICSQNFDELVDKAHLYTLGYFNKYQMAQDYL